MDVYDRLGVKKLINAFGTVTSIGGSLLSCEVLSSMNEAANYFVDINELHAKVGNRIADLLGVDAAYVVAGASAGLALVTAACMTGSNMGNIQQLPNTVNMKNEIVVLKAHTIPFLQAILQTGARIVEIGHNTETYPFELSHAINDKTAAVIYFTNAEKHVGSLPLDEVLEIAHTRGVPVVVEAASELPPVSNLTRYLKVGADVAIFSGGKDIRGPQPTGLILGNKDIVRAASLNASPHYGIGRSMKVGKEEIVGFLTALERYVKEDFAGRMEVWEKQLDVIFDAIIGLEGITVNKAQNFELGVRPPMVPRLCVQLDETRIGVTTHEVANRLREGTPGIVVGIIQQFLVINPQMLRSGEEELVADRLRKILVSR